MKELGSGKNKNRSANGLMRNISSTKIEIQQVIYDCRHRLRRCRVNKKESGGRADTVLLIEDGESRFYRSEISRRSLCRVGCKVNNEADAA